MKIQIAQTDAEILKCFPVMNQLRPHLVQTEFVERVKRQQSNDGFALVYLTDPTGAVKSVAGFRINECLSVGRYLYVDDLVTSEADRSLGFGEKLFGWLVNHAKENNCALFELDSGVQRFAAHRFYFKQKMHIDCYRFSLKL